MIIENNAGKRQRSTRPPTRTIIHLMASGPFDAVFIDFYGTISAGDRDAVLAACRRVVTTFELPFTADELAVRWGESFFGIVDRSNHDEFRSLYECETASLRETLSPFVGPFDPRPFVEELEAYWRDPPIHDDVLHLLEKMHVPICCVSNADCAPLQAAIARHGLRFDAVMCSEESRCYKPEPHIFRKAAAKLGVDPTRAIHVGDSLHSDISGASRLGITTAWLRREERIHDIGTAPPDHTITSLTELLVLIT